MKIFTLCRVVIGNPAKKYLTMKLTVYLLFFSIMQVSASAWSQTVNVSVIAGDKPVREVFKEIQRNSNYRFLYSDDLIDLTSKVHVSSGEQPVEALLTDVTKKTGLRYQILEDNLIVISPARTTQARTVKGRVTSMVDGSGLPGVNVLVKGTSKGTITDVDGNYYLEVEGDNPVLVFSYVGYVTEEVELGDKSVVDVALVENIESLSEIVVTGLSIERDKESLGYSVTQVKGDEVNNVKADNFMDALSGKVAGLQITQSATGVGGSTRVVLRGISSMLGNNRPLFVIDGIPMGAGYNAGNYPNRDYGDALADINPEDIESISVLKGAGAAAVYGNRGANGVILITTKKGTREKGIGLTVNSTYTVDQPFVLPDLQNVYGQGGLRGQYPITNPNNTKLDHPSIWSYGPKMDGSMKIDWTGERVPYEAPPDQFKGFFRNGSNMVNNIAFDAGGDVGSLRVSLTDQRQSGIMPNNDLSRQTFNVRGFTKIKEIFEIDAKVTYIHQNAKNRPLLRENGGNVPLSLSILPRNISLESLKNNIYNKDGNEKTWALDRTFGNPYWSLENMGNNDIKDRYQTYLSIKTIFNDKWDLLLRTGMDQSAFENREWVNKGSFTTANGRGAYSHWMTKSFEWNSDFLLSYNTSVNKIYYGISLGGNYRMNRYSSVSQSGQGLQIPGFYHISNLSEYYTGEWRSDKEVASLYALGNISFDDDVYIDLTYRSDWSSTLPLDENQYNFYSANVSWIFGNTFKLPEFFSLGKLRGSIAQTGNDTGPYSLTPTYNIIQSPLPYSMVGLPGSLLTPDLKPEIRNTWEIGTEWGFFDNRLTFDFTYYYSLAKNQIMSVPIPKSTGYYSKRLNSGELQNTGVELQLTALIIDSPGGFSWEATGTWSKNNSLVKRIHPDLESITLVQEWHASIEARPGEEYGQIIGFDYKRDDKGNVLIDEYGFPMQGELKVHGSVNPDYIFGLSNTFRFKGLSLSFLIDGTMGSEIYSWGKTYKMLWGTDAETLEGREEWFATHDKNGLPIPGVEPGGYVFPGVVESTGEPNTTPIPDMAWRGYLPYSLRVITGSVLDASSIRLREASLTYSFPAGLISKIKMTSLSLALTGRNLFFFYKPADHIDPEAGYSAGNVGNGFEQSALPSTRSIGFNIRIGF